MGKIRENEFSYTKHNIRQNDNYGCTITKIGDRRFKIEKTDVSAFPNRMNAISCFINPYSIYENQCNTLSFKVVESSRPLRYAFDNGVDKKKGDLVGDFGYFAYKAEDYIPRLNLYWGESDKDARIGDFVVIEDVKIETYLPALNDKTNAYPTAYVPHRDDCTDVEMIDYIIRNDNVGKQSTMLFNRDPAVYYGSELQEYIDKDNLNPRFTLAEFYLKVDSYGDIYNKEVQNTPKVPDEYYRTHPISGYGIFLQVDASKISLGTKVWVDKYKELINAYPLYLAEDPVSISREGYSYVLPAIIGNQVELRLRTKAPRLWLNVLQEIEWGSQTRIGLRIIPFRGEPNKAVLRYQSMMYDRANGVYDFRVDLGLSTTSGDGASKWDIENKTKEEELIPLELTLTGSDTAYLKEYKFTKPKRAYLLDILDEAMRQLNVSWLKTDGGSKIKDLTKEYITSVIFELDNLDTQTALYDALYRMLETLGATLILDKDVMVLTTNNNNKNLPRQTLSKMVYTTSAELQPPLNSVSWQFSKNDNNMSWRFRPADFPNECFLTKDEALRYRELYAKGDAQGLAGVQHVRLQYARGYGNDLGSNARCEMELVHMNRLPPSVDRYLAYDKQEGDDNVITTPDDGVFVIDRDPAFVLFSGHSIGKQITGDVPKYPEKINKRIELNTFHLEEMNIEFANVSFDCTLVPIEETVPLVQFLGFDNSAYKGNKADALAHFKKFFELFKLKIGLQFLVNESFVDVELEYGHGKVGTTNNVNVVAQIFKDKPTTIELQGIKTERVPDIRGNVLWWLIDIELDTKSDTFKRLSDGEFQIVVQNAILNHEKINGDERRTLATLMDAYFRFYVKISNIQVSTDITNNGGKTSVFDTHKDGSRSVYFGNYDEDWTKNGKDKLNDTEYGGVWLTPDPYGIGGDESVDLLSLPADFYNVDGANMFNITMRELLKNIENKYAPLAMGAYSQEVMMVGTQGLPHPCMANNFVNFEKWRVRNALYDKLSADAVTRYKEALQKARKISEYKEEAIATNLLSGGRAERRCKGGYETYPFDNTLALTSTDGLYVSFDVDVITPPMRGSFYVAFNYRNELLLTREIGYVSGQTHYKCELRLDSVTSPKIIPPHSICLYSGYNALRPNEVVRGEAVFSNVKLSYKPHDGEPYLDSVGEMDKEFKSTLEKLQALKKEIDESPKLLPQEYSDLVNEIQQDVDSVYEWKDKSFAHLPDVVFTTEISLAYVYKALADYKLALADAYKRAYMNFIKVPDRFGHHIDLSNSTSCYISECEYSLQRDIAKATLLTPRMPLKDTILAYAQKNALDADLVQLVGGEEIKLHRDDKIKVVVDREKRYTKNKTKYSIARRTR